MTTELHNHYKGGPAYHYGVPLNTVMDDWNTKKFLSQHVEVTCWEDLDKSYFNACYRGYLKFSLPE